MSQASKQGWRERAGMQSVGVGRGLAGRGSRTEQVDSSSDLFHKLQGTELSVDVLAGQPEEYPSELQGLPSWDSRLRPQGKASEGITEEGCCHAWGWGVR